MCTLSVKIYSVHAKEAAINSHSKYYRENSNKAQGKTKIYIYRKERSNWNMVNRKNNVTQHFSPDKNNNENYV